MIIIIIICCMCDTKRGDPLDECYRCHRPGHMARDCPGDRGFERAAPPRGR